MPSLTFTQISLIAVLRWRLLRNALRRPQRKIELVAQLLLVIFGGVVVVGIAFALFSATFYLSGANRFRIIGGLLWGVFIAWQLLPVLIAAGGADFNFRELLRFPLSYPAFLLLNLSYALFDPAALSALVWLASIAAGLILARPALGLAIAPAFLALAATSLLLNRVILSWLERLLARRRGREIFFLVFVLFMLTAQLFGASIESWGRSALPYLKPLLAVLSALPPGLALDAVLAAQEKNPAAAAAAIGGLLAYALAFYALLQRRLRSQYRGEELSEAAAPAAERGARHMSWRLTALSAPVAAIVEKELRYIGRSGFLLLNLAVPLFIPAVLGVVSAGPRGARNVPEFFSRAPELLFPSCMAYAALVLMHLATNHYAFEGHGIQLFFVTPVRFREVLLAKNIVYASILLTEALLIWVMLTLFGVRPGLEITLVTFAALPALTLAQVSTGNLLSLYFPRRFDFNKFKQRQSPVSVLLALLQQIITVGAASIILMFARAYGHTWIAGMVFLVVGAGVWQAYTRVLDSCERLAARRRESLIAELCHD